jgi:hypothetical protein
MFDSLQEVPMQHPDHRVTLIARVPTKPDFDWNYSRCRCENVAFLDSLSTLKYAVGTVMQEDGLDIERIIVDRSGTAEEFLDLLVVTPPELTGDLVMIRDDGSGFLSATGRGGDRVMYSLTSHDMRFYLETQDLVTGRVALAMTA